jgi:glyoxylase-like metal-dependent hydrolase (beta-lactamase superfamily II)
MKKYIGLFVAALWSATMVQAAEVDQELKKESSVTKESEFTLGQYGAFKFEKVNGNVYVMHGPVVEPNKENEGFMNNPAIIEGKTGLIIVDPGGNYNVGKKILAQIEKVSKKPVLAVFNTHKHGDHWFANKAIVEKYPHVTIYAHEHMIKVAKEGEADKWYGILDRMTEGNLDGTKAFAYPTKALKMGDKVEVEGETFVVRHPKVAHTDTDLLIEHVNSKTLFLGDNVMRGRLGAFDSSSSLLANITLLEEVKSKKALTLYVPGHGRSGKRDETIDPYLNYLKIVKEEVAKAYEDDKQAYEVKDKVLERLKTYKDWDAIDHVLGKHMSKAYAEIEMSDM